MAKRKALSARKELRALLECALAREADIPEAAARRVVNRILRRSDRIAEIGGALCAARADAEAAPAPAPKAEPEPAPAAPARIEPHEEAFDPYAIGAVVTLQRFGREVLLERLATVTRTEDLVRLASAQNLFLTAAWSNAEELRAAIVEGAMQRLAERHAAAS